MHNLIIGGSTAAVLTNSNNIISGAGNIGGGRMTLANAGTINGTGSQELIIDTGAVTIINSGLLEASGRGGLVIDSNVANSGTIWANGGNVTIHGDITGGGTAVIGGMASLEFGGQADLKVTMADATAQTLIFGGLGQFLGSLYGLGDGDTLEFAAFKVASVLTYQIDADGLGGILTLADQDDVLTVRLEGKYEQAGFMGIFQEGHGFIVSYDGALLA